MAIGWAIHSVCHSVLQPYTHFEWLTWPFVKQERRQAFANISHGRIDFWRITEADTQHLAVELMVNTNRKVANSGPKGRELRKRQRVRGEQCRSRAKVGMVSGGVGPRQENWIGTWSQRMVSASHMVLSKMSEERYWSAVIWGGQESGFNLLSPSMHGTS